MNNHEKPEIEVLGCRRKEEWKKNKKKNERRSEALHVMVSPNRRIGHSEMPRAFLFGRFFTSFLLHPSSYADHQELFVATSGIRFR